MSAILIDPSVQFSDSNNNPVPAGSVIRFFDAGTTNLKTVYSDVALSVAVADDLPLDADGRLPVTIYCPDGESYFWQVRTEAGGGGSVIDEADNVWGYVNITSVYDTISIDPDLGDGVTDATAAFQAAVNSIASKGTIFIPSGNYVVDLRALTYGSKAIRWDFDESASTTHVTLPQGYYFTGGGAGSTDNVAATVGAGDQIDVYRVVGNNNATGTGKLFAFHFDLEAAGTGSEPVRGLIGNVTNQAGGTGDLKAIRVGAIDLNTTAGATSLMGIAVSVTPNAQSSNVRILDLANNADAVDDNATAINIKANGATQSRWQNGIVFEQGDEFNDAVIQASMGAGSAGGARFLKLKDGAAVILYEVDKDGLVRSTDGFHAGSSVTNSIHVQSSEIARTAAGGNIAIKSGTDAATTISVETSGSTRLVIRDDGIHIGGSSAPTINSGSGTPEGVVTAIVGSQFMRTDGGAGTSFYVKESGTGNTGWVAK